MFRGRKEKEGTRGKEDNFVSLTGHARRTKRTAGQSALSSNLDQIWDRFGEKICAPRTIVYMRAVVGGLLCPFGQFWTRIVHMRDSVGDALREYANAGRIQRALLDITF